MSAERLPVPTGLVAMRDPDDESLVTLCESDATGEALAERWLTVSEGDLLSVEDCR
jgi:hypothetical protein